MLTARDNSVINDTLVYHLHGKGLGCCSRNSRAIKGLQRTPVLASVLVCKRPRDVKLIFDNLLFARQTEHPIEVYSRPNWHHFSNCWNVKNAASVNWMEGNTVHSSWGDPTIFGMCS